MTESASWPFFYAGGFPTVKHPTLIKGTSEAAEAARKAASRLWGPIDQKAEQLTDYLTEFAGEFGAKFTLSIRAPLNFNAVEKGKFKQKLVTYFQSRITEKNALLRRFLLTEKLDGDDVKYGLVVSDGRAGDRGEDLGDLRRGFVQGLRPQTTKRGRPYFQSATKRFVSPCFFEWRFEAQMICLPSGRNIGKPSKVASKVTRSSLSAGAMDADASTR